MSRVLLITPARDEATHLETAIRAVMAQTRPPDRWLIVDDGSTDATPRILERFAAELPFLDVLWTPARSGRAETDGLAIAAEARAFNAALTTVDTADFTHIGKLDADIELPPDYFEGLLERFAADSELGIAGGTLLERSGGDWQPTKIPTYHVRGAVKLYSRECFMAIGGIEERLGWDTIDETYARMRGYATRSLPELAARHHRPVATRGGTLRGRARHGQCAYVLRYGAWWVALRSLKVACSRPYGFSGVAFLYGYLRSALRRDDRVEDEGYRRFVAQELRDRAWLAVGRGAQISNQPKDTKVPTFFMRS
jgi:glycosyltransferase involved in cell wall biosynthesis